MIEGTINSGIKAMIIHHRGMPTEHRRRAVEWFCCSHADPAARPPLGELPEPGQYTPHARTPAQPEEGVYSRQGWSGRNQ